MVRWPFMHLEPKFRRFTDAFHGLTQGLALCVASLQRRNRRHKQSVLVAFEDNREAAKLPSLLHGNPFRPARYSILSSLFRAASFCRIDQSTT